MKRQQSFSTLQSTRTLCMVSKRCFSGIPTAGFFPSHKTPSGHCTDVALCLIASQSQLVTASCDLLIVLQMSLYSAVKTVFLLFCNPTFITMSTKALLPFRIILSWLQPFFVCRVLSGFPRMKCFSFFKIAVFLDVSPHRWVYRF